MEKERKKQALEANHYSLSALKAIKWADENPLISAKLVDKVLACAAFKTYIAEKMIGSLVADDKHRRWFVQKLYASVMDKKEEHYEACNKEAG